MTDRIRIRHVVSIAGVVHEPLPGDRPSRRRPMPPRIANAQVEILVDQAPQLFQTMVHARFSDPAYVRRRERIDRTWSQFDGIFYFLDLPAGEEGEGYQLRVSVPHMGTRYDTETTALLHVHANPDGEPVQTTWVDVELAPTRIHGTVSRLTVDNMMEPVANARVRLGGDRLFELTDEDGRYELTHLVASRPTLEVAADGFALFRKQVMLQAGQAQEENIQLRPS